jgi:O-antigen/teichoic acid export membrane protein
MSALSLNLAASFFSRGWSAVLSLAFVPVYIRFLGVEAYGLIGAFTALQTIVSLLDLGLGSALTREFARSNGQPNAARAMRDLLRTLECIYWAIALLIAVGLWLLAGYIANHWLRPEDLSAAEVEHALAYAGLAFALQWPTTLYSGGMYGLERQGLLAAVVSATSTLRVAVTVMALAFVSPTLESFFIAQAFANLVQTLSLAWALWRCLPASGARAAFDPAMLRGLVGFAGGMFGISVSAVVLTQLDKAILSRTLTLEAFGYYAVASALAAGLYVLISPLFAVFFPRFSQLVAARSAAEVERLYHLGNQLMAVTTLPLTAVVVFFADEILRLWTGSDAIAANSGALLSLIVVGNALNGLMNIPYAVQLAHGWTSLAFYSNVVAIVLCAPLIYMLSVRIGAIGGAISWVTLTSGYILISLQIMYAKLRDVGPRWRWHVQDVGAPAAAAFIVAGAGRSLDVFPGTPLLACVFLALVTGLATLGAGLCAPALRAAVTHRVSTAWRGSRYRPETRFPGQ